MTVITSELEFDVEVPEFGAFLENNRAKLCGFTLNEAAEIFANCDDGGASGVTASEAIEWHAKQVDAQL